MKHKVKVVYLPTEDSSNIAILGYNTKLTYRFAEYNFGAFHTPQHVYITISQSVELIKEGDFIIVSGSLYYYNPHQKENNSTVPSIAILLPEDRKIVVTTDPKLLKEHDDTVPYPKMRSTGVAEVQQSFLEEFVSNPEGEFEIEYEEYFDENKAKAIKVEDYTSDEYHKLTLSSKLKLNQDNTINITSVSNLGLFEPNRMEFKPTLDNITSVEEKMYTETQVIGLLKVMSSIPDSIYEDEYMPDWIKENL